MFARTLGLARLFTPRNASCAKIHQPVARLLRQPLLYLLWQHLIWHLVCVCVCVCQDEFLSHISSCALSQSINWQQCHNKTGSFEWHPQFMQKQRVRRWDGAFFSCSSKASNSFTQNARQIETGRSGKREAKKWLYKIQPLRQQKAIAIWPSASEHGYSIHEAKRHSLDFTLRRALWSTAFQRSLFILLVPTAILQSQGFWQHKGLGKNINTYYDFGCECHPDLQRLGYTKRARLLLEVDINLEGIAKYCCWILFLNRLTTWKKTTRQWGDTFNEHHTAFTTNISVEHVVWPHLQCPHKPWTHRTCCWQGNSAD